MDNKKENDKKIEFTEVNTVRYTPKDGLVNEYKIVDQGLPSDKYGKYRMGYSTGKRFTTSDPRVVKPALKMMYVFFMLVTFFVCLITRNFFMLLLIVPVVSYGFIKSIKQVNDNSEKLKKQGYDVTIDSEEEKEEIKAEIIDIVSTQFNESVKETFSKEKLDWFIKTTMPLYIIISLLGIVMCFFASKILAIVAAVIFLLVGIFFYVVLLGFLKKKYGK